MDLKEFEERKKKRIPAGEGQAAALRVPLEQIPHRIAVWSGKGGVGKTTIAIHLALAFAEKGKTGLLDADIDCPNIPAVLGIQERMGAASGKITPLTHADFPDLQMVSMGSIIGPDALLWRGPMISSAIAEFLYKVNWDVRQLVIDMPPGSSDAALTVAQQLRPQGLILVTTSDPSAMADTRRSIRFAKRLRVPVYGIVENMRGDIFGSGGGEWLAREFHLPFLGALPLDKKIPTYIREHTPLRSNEYGSFFREIVHRILS